MKKMILIFVWMILPLAAMAMTPMSETDLSNICCRAGVTIIFDVTMNIHFDCIAWGDPDGYGSAPVSSHAGNSSNSYSSASETSVIDSSGLPNTVRLDPDTMTLTPHGTEYYLYDDIFNHTTLRKQ